MFRKLILHGRQFGSRRTGIAAALWLAMAFFSAPRAETLFQRIFASKREVSMLSIAEKVGNFTETVEVREIVFSNNGAHVAIKAEHETIRIVDWSSGDLIQVLRKDAGANSALTRTSMLYSPDDKFFVACHERSNADVVIRVWNTRTWQIVHDIVDPIPGGCASIAFTPDGRFLLRASLRNPLMKGDNISVYDTNGWQFKWGIRTVPFYPKILSVSPDGKFAAIGGEYIPASPLPASSQIIIVDIRNHTIANTIAQTVSTKFGAIQWNPRGTQIAVIGDPPAISASAADGKAELEAFSLFDGVAGTKIGSAKWGNSGRRSLKYTPDGRYLLEGDANGNGAGLGLRIWDGQHSQLFAERLGNIGALAVSPTGGYFAVGQDKSVEVWKFK